jgi:hypothetical protein
VAETRESRLHVHRWQFARGDGDDLMRPRFYCYSDGDGTNALYWTGIQLSTKHGDALLDFGCEVVVPPRWFPVLDALSRLLGRGAGQDG